MTALLDRPTGEASWADMPGWGVVADLTPPELIAARKLHRLRRLLGFGMIAILIACGGGYFYAHEQSSSAQDDLANANAATTALQAQAAKYNSVTQVQAAAQAVQQQIAGVMTADVDQAALVDRVHAALPGTMSISSLSISITPQSSGGASPAAPPAGGSTTGGTTSGSAAGTSTVIGTLTISGVGRTLDDLPAFVDRLAAVPGITNVLPGTNSTDRKIAQFSLTASLTDSLYSHRYAVKAGG